MIRFADPAPRFDSTLETEFRDVYRRPGARYLGLAALMGTVSALAFYGLDALLNDLRWVGGAQTMRLAFAAFCFS